MAVGEAPEAEVLGDINDLTISPAQIKLLQTVSDVIVSSLFILAFDFLIWSFFFAGCG